MEAIAELPDVQVPAEVVLVNEELSPLQKAIVPAIAAGNGFTVIEVVCLQPVDSV
jgi:hypothetical protein